MRGARGGRRAGVASGRTASQADGLRRERTHCFGTAAQVRARRGAKSATTDWMKMERERGISISSTAVRQGA